MSYLDGVCAVIGEDKVFTDKGTVKSAQIALKMLSQKTGNAAFDPIEIDGKIGPHTRAAVTAFNAAYGWPSDGDKITEGTFTAMMRPDVMNPTRAGSGVIVSDSPPLPPTPKQVDKMVAPVVDAPSPSPESPRAPSVFQREKPKSMFADAETGKAIEYTPGEPSGSSTAKWVFIGITAVASAGVLWLVVDALRGRRSSGGSGGGGSAPRGTLVGYRRA